MANSTGVLGAKEISLTHLSPSIFLLVGTSRGTLASTKLWAFWSFLFLIFFCFFLPLFVGTFRCSFSLSPSLPPFHSILFFIPQYFFTFFLYCPNRILSNRNKINSCDFWAFSIYSFNFCLLHHLNFYPIFYFSPSHFLAGLFKCSRFMDRSTIYSIWDKKNAKFMWNIHRRALTLINAQSVLTAPSMPCFLNDLITLPLLHFRSICRGRCRSATLVFIALSCSLIYGFFFSSLNSLSIIYPVLSFV